MRTGIALLILSAALGLGGCGGRPPEPAPLSITAWEALPVDQKYTSETLERLKAGNPQLQTAEGWDTFSRTTVARNRKKDFPGGKSPPRK